MQSEKNSHAQSTREIPDINKEDFSSKVVNFSMKDIDAACDHNDSISQNQNPFPRQRNTERFGSNKINYKRKHKVAPEINSEIVTLRTSKNAHTQNSVQNSIAGDKVEVSSQATSVRKRTAFINLKNLASSQSEKEAKPQDSEQVIIQTENKENSEPFNSWVKGHLILPKSMKERQNEGEKLQVVSRKPSVIKEE